MEKLLAERMREIDPRSNFCAHDLLAKGKCPDDVGCVECTRRALESLADEIERCYIPRTRFEDGEPVQFGDEVELHYKGGGCDEGRIQAFHANRGPVWILSFVGCDHERLFRYDSENDTLKRPTPKVYDADGVEIKVGDAVWNVEACQQGNVYWDKQLTVISLSGTHATVYQDSAETKTTLPLSLISHEKPVFDADGERIRKGDTVYEVATGHESVVHRTDSCNSAGEPIVCKDGCIGELWYKPEELTHREPDSLEKALRDLDLFLEGHHMGDRHILEGVRDRFAALIERGA